MWNKWGRDYKTLEMAFSLSTMFDRFIWRHLACRTRQHIIPFCLSLSSRNHHTKAFLHGARLLHSWQVLVISTFRVQEHSYVDKVWFWQPPFYIWRDLEIYEEGQMSWQSPFCSVCGEREMDLRDFLRRWVFPAEYDQKSVLLETDSSGCAMAPLIPFLYQYRSNAKSGDTGLQ